MARSGSPLERCKCVHVEVKGFGDEGTRARGLSCVRGGGNILIVCSRKRTIGMDGQCRVKSIVREGLLMSLCGFEAK